MQWAKPLSYQTVQTHLNCTMGRCRIQQSLECHVKRMMTSEDVSDNNLAIGTMVLAAISTTSKDMTLL